MSRQKELASLEGTMAILKGNPKRISQPVLILEIQSGGWNRTIALITAWLPDEDQEDVIKIYGTQRVDLDESLIFPRAQPTTESNRCQRHSVAGSHDCDLKQMFDTVQL